MGTDIHLVVERRSGAVWEPVAVYCACSVCRGRGVLYDGRECAFCGVDHMRPGFPGRDYIAFSILAGVRAWSDLPCIGPDRGVPADASDFTKSLKNEIAPPDAEKKYGECYLGDYGFTWVGLDEILAYNWRYTFTHDSRIWTIRDFVGPGFWEFVGKSLSFGQPEDVRWIFGFDS